MISAEAQAVEQGILRAVGKLVTIGLLLAILGALVYGWYTNTEDYQDRKAQEEMINQLEHIR